jgi:YD repeat-containing protein
MDLKGAALRWLKSGVVTVALLFAATAAAQTSSGRMPWQEYNERIRSAELMAPLTSELFGDQISLSDGSTEFVVTDIDLPGNSALPVQLRRRLKVESKKEMEFFSGFGEWDLDVPYLYGVFTSAGKWNVSGNGATNRCSENWYPKAGTFYDLDEIWSGNYLHLPGSGDQLMMYIGNSGAPVPTQGGPYFWSTRDFNVFSCTSPQPVSQGEGFVLHTPDGLRYTFDVAIERSAGRLNKHGTLVGRSKVFLAASRAEDRFGNWVAWRYSGDKLVAVEANDGRRIDIGWSGNEIATATTNGRRWSYAYGANGDNNVYRKPRLISVQQPDGHAWRYTYTGSLSPTYVPLDVGGRGCPSMPAPIVNFVVDAEHPSGAQGRFDFKLSRHRRSGTPANACVADSKPGLFRLLVPDYFDVYSLRAKQITGAGLEPRTWTYTYRNNGSVRATGPIPCESCRRDKQVIVEQPDKSEVHYTFGTLFGDDNGRLLKTETHGPDLMRKETVRHADSAGQPFPDVYGFPWGVDDPAAAKIRPLQETIIEQDGETYVRTVDTFDAFARPRVVTRSNSLNYGRYDRTEQMDYHDNLAGWVLGQQRSTIELSPVNGRFISSIVFDSRDLPWRTYSFNRLLSERTYLPDGTLHDVRDGLYFSTRLSNWKRGVPQNIQYPDGSQEALQVDDNGWITSATDRRGAVREYVYDAMGRLSSLVQPQGDQQPWNASHFSLERVAGAQFGIPGGHWQHTVSTGDARRRTILDALWQPLVSESWDARDRAGTLSQSVSRYGSMGRRRFISRATRALEHVNAFIPGTTTEHDALGRVVRKVEDSELGALITQTQYLNKNRIHVTSPAGVSTTTAFMAWDLPETQYAVVVEGPEGTYTDIERDGYGKPLVIRRRNADSSTAISRRYVYDQFQQRCKQTEPESGATVLAFNAVGNLEWSASGLSDTDPADCSFVVGYASPSRIERSYNSEGLLTSLRFADGNGDQHWAYWPDGKLKRVVVSADGRTTTSEYDYNLRGLLTSQALRVGSDAAFSLSHRYDANGSLSGHRYPDGQDIDYAPNALGQPTRVGSFATHVRHHPNGAVASFRFGNGIEQETFINPRGLVERNRHQAGTSAVLDDHYDYDLHGNVAAISDGTPGARGDRDLSYDGLDRLRSAQSPMFGTASYGYDVLDNLRRVTVADRDHDYVYDGANRLVNVVDHATQATVMGLSYDSLGNVLRRNGQEFQFDHANQLRAVPGLERYQYDGHGRRVRAIDATNAAITSFYDLGGVLRVERDHRQAQNRNYTYLGGKLIARATSLAEPGPPTVDVPGWSTTGTYVVSWSPVTGAETYEVTEASVSGTAELYRGPALSMTVEGRGPDQYSYRARACNTVGCSDWSEAASTFVGRPPREPAGIESPEVGAAGNFTVTWKPPVPREEGPTEYRLEIEEGSVWTEAYYGPLLQHVFKAVPAGTYRFRARSCNPWGCSEPVLSGPTRVVYPPATPEVTVPALHIGAHLPVRWSAQEGALRYELDEQFEGGGWVRVYTGAAVSTTLGNRLSGHYGYRVQACNEGGCSALSAAAFVKVVVAPLVAPELSHPGSSHSGAFTLSWNSLPYVDSYVVHELVPGGGWQGVHSGTTLQASIHGRWTGQWRYRIQACNAAGCGPWSRETSVSVLLPPDTPALTYSKRIRMTHMSGTSWRCRVNWTAVSHTSRYELQNPSGAIVGFGSAEHSVSTVVGNGTFPKDHVACWSQHAVRACNAAGCSAWSPFRAQEHEYIDDRP